MLNAGWVAAYDAVAMVRVISATAAAVVPILKATERIRPPPFATASGRP
jgi:hypothetical protein